jgi:hypothetical protein
MGHRLHIRGRGIVGGLDNILMSMSAVRELYESVIPILEKKRGKTGI